jgi:hypothetical protein
MDVAYARHLIWGTVHNDASRQAGTIYNALPGRHNIQRFSLSCREVLQISSSIRK